jgi:hypothetical protein
VAIYGGAITVADYSFDSWIVRIGAGETFKLDAVNNIEIFNEIEADSIELYSALGAVSQADNLLDTRSDEALRSLELLVSAKTGVNLDSVETPLLSVTNTGDGDISIGVNGVRSGSPIGRFSNSQITGDVAVARLVQTLAGGSGDIALTARGGSIDVLSGTVSQASAIRLNGSTATGVDNPGSGSTALVAQGAGENLVIGQDLVSRGALTLSAAGGLTTRSGVDLSTLATGADITLSAVSGDITLGGNLVSGSAGSSGGLVSLSAGSAIVMADGTSITSVGSSGRASLVAAGDIALSRVAVTSTVEVRSNAGAILDALTGDNANLQGEAADAVLYAANGIGAAGADLRTALGTLVATNTASGGIYVHEATGQIGRASCRERVS